MSKYRKIETVFKSEAALRQALEDACAEFGISYEYHPEPANLIGYRGDMRPERAEYIIRRSYVDPAANDVGYARQPDGTFAAIVSDYDNGTGAYAEREKNPKISFIEYRYQYHVVCEYAAANGYTVTEEETADGVQLALEQAW